MLDNWCYKQGMSHLFIWHTEFVKFVSFQQNKPTWSLFNTNENESVIEAEPIVNISKNIWKGRYELVQIKTYNDLFYFPELVGHRQLQLWYLL